MSDNSASRERKAPPARSEDGPPRTRGNLGAPQIWHPNPAGSPCVCDLFPWLSPPEEGRDPAGETLGMERPRERMWPVDREVSLRGEGGGEVRGHTYCSWGSARMASGPATPCPGFGHGGAPAPVPGLAPVLAPSPGPSIRRQNALAGPALLLALCRPAGPGAPAGMGKGEFKGSLESAAHTPLVKGRL